MSKDELAGKVYKVVDYYPYRIDGERNPRCDDKSRSIMDVKNPKSPGHSAGINRYANFITKSLKKITQDVGVVRIVVTPSSTAGEISPGLNAIAQICAENPNVIYDEPILIRTESIPKSHKGGDRSIETHLRTISCNQIENPEVPILLIDDVRTTGATIDACRQILEQAGAKYVAALCLGQTTH